MTRDPANAHTFSTLLAAKSHATNNVGSAGLDMNNYVGRLAVRVNIGVKTAGDNDGAVTVTIKAAANNTLGEATAISGTNTVATTNNTAASGTITVDRRAEYRYLFALVTLSGTNSPAYPVAVEAVGTKQVQ